jgi:hypothetical protein
MQRRAAAIYAAFFIIVAAGSYAVIGVAQQPDVTVENPDYSLAAGDQVSFDGQTYTVGQIKSGTNEGDSLRSTELSWVNRSARYTATFENNSTVSSQAVQWQGQRAPARNESYRVLVENASDPSTFTFRQEFNVSRRLAEDSAVEDQTITRSDGQRYVVYEENGSTRPLSAYLPEPETREFSEGDTLRYQNNSTTVSNVSAGSVVVEWTGTRNNSLSLEEGGRTTFGGTQYVAHFPDNSTFALTSDLEAYDAETEAVATYHERINGFWGVSIISALAAMLLLAVAYLPSRY